MTFIAPADASFLLGETREHSNTTSAGALTLISSRGTNRLPHR